MDTRNKKLDKRFEKKIHYTKLNLESEYIDYCDRRHMKIRRPYKTMSTEIEIPKNTKHCSKIFTKIDRAGGCWTNSSNKRTIYDKHSLEYEYARWSHKTGTSIIKTAKLHMIDDEYILEEIKKPLFKEITRSNQMMFKYMRQNKREKINDEPDDMEAILFDVGGDEEEMNLREVAEWNEFMNQDGTVDE